MHKLINTKQKYTMFHDEQKDLFVLLSSMAIYKYSKSLLLVTCWKKSIVNSIEKQSLNINEPWKDDENCYSFYVDIEHFQKLFAYNQYVNSKQYTKAWLNNKSNRLGHDIIRHYILQ